MKNLETLIRELCPDGVEFVKLRDCCSFKRGTTITAKMQFLEMYLFWLVVKNQLIIITWQTEQARLLWLLVRGHMPVLSAIGLFLYFSQILFL